MRKIKTGYFGSYNLNKIFFEIIKIEACELRGFKKLIKRRYLTYKKIPG